MSINGRFQFYIFMSLHNSSLLSVKGNNMPEEYIEQDSIETPAGFQTNAPWGLDRIDDRAGTGGVYAYNSESI